MPTPSSLPPPSSSVREITLRCTAEDGTFKLGTLSTKCLGFLKWKNGRKGGGRKEGRKEGKKENYRAISHVLTLKILAN